MQSERKTSSLQRPKDYLGNVGVYTPQPYAPLPNSVSQFSRSGLAAMDADINTGAGFRVVFDAELYYTLKVGLIETNVHSINDKVPIPLTCASQCVLPKVYSVLSQGSGTLLANPKYKDINQPRQPFVCVQNEKQQYTYPVKLTVAATDMIETSKQFGKHADQIFKKLNVTTNIFMQRSLVHSLLVKGDIEANNMPRIYKTDSIKTSKLVLNNECIDGLLHDSKELIYHPEMVAHNGNTMQPGKPFLYGCNADVMSHTDNMVLQLKDPRLLRAYNTMLRVFVLVESLQVVLGLNDLETEETEQFQKTLKMRVYSDESFKVLFISLYECFMTLTQVHLNAEEVRKELILSHKLLQNLHVLSKKQSSLSKQILEYLSPFLHLFVVYGDLSVDIPTYTCSAPILSPLITHRQYMHELGSISVDSTSILANTYKSMSSETIETLNNPIDRAQLDMALEASYPTTYNPIDYRTIETNTALYTCPVQIESFSTYLSKVYTSIFSNTPMLRMPEKLLYPSLLTSTSSLSIKVFATHAKVLDFYIKQSSKNTLHLMQLELVKYELVVLMQGLKRYLPAFVSMPTSSPKEQNNTPKQLEIGIEDMKTPSPVPPPPANIPMHSNNGMYYHTIPVPSHFNVAETLHSIYNIRPLLKNALYHTMINYMVHTSIMCHAATYPVPPVHTELVNYLSRKYKATVEQAKVMSNNRSACSTTYGQLLAASSSYQDVGKIQVFCPILPLHHFFCSTIGFLLETQIVPRSFPNKVISNPLSAYYQPGFYLNAQFVQIDTKTRLPNNILESALAQHINLLTQACLSVEAPYFIDELVHKDVCFMDLNLQEPGWSAIHTKWLQCEADIPRSIRSDILYKILPDILVHGETPYLSCSVPTPEMLSIVCSSPNTLNALLLLLLQPPTEKPASTEVSSMTYLLIDARVSLLRALEAQLERFISNMAAEVHAQHKQNNSLEQMLLTSPPNAYGYNTEYLHLPSHVNDQCYIRDPSVVYFNTVIHPLLFSMSLVQVVRGVFDKLMIQEEEETRSVLVVCAELEAHVSSRLLLEMEQSITQEMEYIQHVEPCWKVEVIVEMYLQPIKSITDDVVYLHFALDFINTDTNETENIDTSNIYNDTSMHDHAEDGSNNSDPDILTSTSTSFEHPFYSVCREFLHEQEQEMYTTLATRRDREETSLQMQYDENETHKQEILALEEEAKAQELVQLDLEALAEKEETLRKKKMKETQQKQRKKKVVKPVISDTTSICNIPAISPKQEKSAYKGKEINLVPVANVHACNAFKSFVTSLRTKLNIDFAPQHMLPAKDITLGNQYHGHLLSIMALQRDAAKLRGQDILTSFCELFPLYEAHFQVAVEKEILTEQTLLQQEQIHDLSDAVLNALYKSHQALLTQYILAPRIAADSEYFSNAHQLDKNPLAQSLASFASSVQPLYTDSNVHLPTCACLQCIKKSLDKEWTHPEKLASAKTAHNGWYPSQVLDKLPFLVERDRNPDPLTIRTHAEVPWGDLGLNHATMKRMSIPMLTDKLNVIKRCLHSYAPKINIPFTSDAKGVRSDPFPVKCASGQVKWACLVIAKAKKDFTPQIYFEAVSPPTTKSKQVYHIQRYGSLVPPSEIWNQNSGDSDEKSLCKIRNVRSDANHTSWGHPLQQRVSVTAQELRDFGNMLLSPECFLSKDAMSSYQANLKSIKVRKSHEEKFIPRQLNNGEVKPIEPKPSPIPVALSTYPEVPAVKILPETTAHSFIQSLTAGMYAHGHVEGCGEAASVRRCIDIVGRLSVYKNGNTNISKDKNNMQLGNTSITSDYSTTNRVYIENKEKKQFRVLKSYSRPAYVPMVTSKIPKLFPELTQPAEVLNTKPLQIEDKDCINFASLPVGTELNWSAHALQDTMYIAYEKKTPANLSTKNITDEQILQFLFQLYCTQSNDDTFVDQYTTQFYKFMVPFHHPNGKRTKYEIDVSRGVFRSLYDTFHVYLSSMSSTSHSNNNTNVSIHNSNTSDIEDMYNIYNELANEDSNDLFSSAQLQNMLEQICSHNIINKNNNTHILEYVNPFIQCIEGLLYKNTEYKSKHLAFEFSPSMDEMNKSMCISLNSGIAWQDTQNMQGVGKMKVDKYLIDEREQGLEGIVKDDNEDSCDDSDDDSDDDDSDMNNKHRKNRNSSDIESDITNSNSTSTSNMKVESIPISSKDLNPLTHLLKRFKTCYTTYISTKDTPEIDMYGAHLRRPFPPKPFETTHTTVSCQCLFRAKNVSSTTCIFCTLRDTIVSQHTSADAIVSEIPPYAMNLHVRPGTSLYTELERICDQSNQEILQSQYPGLEVAQMLTGETSNLVHVPNPTKEVVSTHLGSIHPLPMPPAESYTLHSYRGIYHSIKYIKLSRQFFMQQVRARVFSMQDEYMRLRKIREQHKTKDLLQSACYNCVNEISQQQLALTLQLEKILRQEEEMQNNVMSDDANVPSTENHEKDVVLQKLDILDVANKLFLNRLTKITTDMYTLSNIDARSLKTASQAQTNSLEANRMFLLMRYYELTNVVNEKNNITIPQKPQPKENSLPVVAVFENSNSNTSNTLENSSSSTSQDLEEHLPKKVRDHANMNNMNSGDLVKLESASNYVNTISNLDMKDETTVTNSTTNSTTNTSLLHMISTEDSQQQLETLSILEQCGIASAASILAATTTKYIPARDDDTVQTEKKPHLHARKITEMLQYMESKEYLHSNEASKRLYRMKYYQQLCVLGTNAQTLTSIPQFEVASRVLTQYFESNQRFVRREAYPADEVILVTQEEEYYAGNKKSTLPIIYAECLEGCANASSVAMTAYRAKTQKGYYRIAYNAIKNAEEAMKKRKLHSMPKLVHRNVSTAWVFSDPSNRNKNKQRSVVTKDIKKKLIRYARSSIHEWGVYALEPISKGELIVEYLGEVISAELGDTRETHYERNGQNSSYLFRLDDRYIVDAMFKGNIARFINHSCDANCFPKVINKDKKPQIFIFASKDIEPGEELVYDYKFPLETIKFACYCGSPKCKKFLN